MALVGVDKTRRRLKPERCSTAKRRSGMEDNGDLVLPASGDCSGAGGAGGGSASAVTGDGVPSSAMVDVSARFVDKGIGALSVSVPRSTTVSSMATDSPTTTQSAVATLKTLAVRATLARSAICGRRCR